MYQAAVELSVLALATEQLCTCLECLESRSSADAEQALKVDLLQRLSRLIEECS